jgi:hypothetical protein
MLFGININLQSIPTPIWCGLLVIAGLGVGAYVYVHGPRSASTTPPSPAPPVVQAPTPQPKKVEAKKPELRKAEAKKAERTKSEAKKEEDRGITTGAVPMPALPCFDLGSIMDLVSTVEARGNHEFWFKALYTRRPACVILTITGIDDEHFELKTATVWRWQRPTIYVQPLSHDDLHKYQIGDKVRIEGTWQRYFRLSEEPPDQIFINEASITKVE